MIVYFIEGIHKDVPLKFLTFMGTDIYIYSLKMSELFVRVDCVSLIRTKNHYHF